MMWAWLIAAVIQRNELRAVLQLLVVLGWWSDHLQNVEGDDSVGFLKTYQAEWSQRNMEVWFLPALCYLSSWWGNIVPFHTTHSLSATEHPHVQALTLGSPIKARGWGNLQLCQASCVVALMAVEPMLSRTADPDVCAPHFCVPRWSQRAAFPCVAPELKLHPQALLCINWNLLEWDGKYTYFKNILFGILILI